MSEDPKKGGQRSRSRSGGRARSWARRLAMQALYQWQIGANNLDEIETQFRDEQDLSRADRDYFQELLHQVPAHLAAVNDALGPYLDRPLDQVDPVEKAILWIAGYELIFRSDIPYRVVLNEAVELAKDFGAQQGHRFVNGVLDRAAHQLRAGETGH